LILPEHQANGKDPIEALRTETREGRRRRRREGEFNEGDDGIRNITFESI